MTDPRADIARERALRTEAEQAELYRTPKARLNNALLWTCIVVLLGGLIVIGALLLWFLYGWPGVIGGAIFWIILSLAFLAVTIARAKARQ